MKKGSQAGPSIAEIETAAHALTDRIVATPMLELNAARVKHHLPKGSRVHMKLELFQQAGSFKSRGVLLAIDAMDQQQRDAGVTAVSAGNHALATAWGEARSAGLVLSSLRSWSAVTFFMTTATMSGPPVSDVPAT